MSFGSRRSRRDEPSLEEIIMDVAASYIDDQANRKRGLREDYADMVGKNKFRTKEFEAIVNTLADQFDVLERRYGSGGRKSVEEIIDAAVPDFIDGHFAYCVMQDRKATSELTDKEYADMSDVADRWEREWVEDSRSSRRDRDDRPRERGIGRSEARRRGRDESTGRHSVRDFKRSRHRDDDQEPDRDSVHNHWDDLADLGRSKDPEPKKRREDPPVRRSVVIDDEEEPEVVHNMSVRVPPIPHKASARGNGPDYTKPRPHAHFFQNGERWQFCMEGTELLPGLPGESSTGIPTLFDVNTHLKFYITSDTYQRRQEDIPVTDENRYLQQELLHHTVATPDQPAIYASIDGPRTNPSPILQKRNTLLSDVLGGMSNQQIEAAFRDNESYQMLASLNEAAARVMISMSNKPDEPVQLMTFITRDIAVVADYSPAVEAQLNKLLSAGTLTMVHQYMTEMKPTMNPVLFDKLNERFTRVILESCCYQWQFYMKVFNFYQHWVQMLDLVMTKRESPEYVAAFIQRTSALIPRVLTRLKPTDVPRHLPDLISEGEQPNVVVFIDYEYVLGLQYTIDELGIGRQLEDAHVGIAIADIPHEETPLTDVVRNIYSHSVLNEIERTTTPLQLVTKDAKTLTIWPHMCRQSKFILCKRV